MTTQRKRIGRRAMSLALLASVLLPGWHQQIVGTAGAADPEIKQDGETRGTATRPPQVKPAAPAKYEGRTVDEWLERWRSETYDESREAQAVLTSIGEPVVPIMMQLIRDGDPKAGYAVQILTKMGPAARTALPYLKEIAQNPDWPDPNGWTWNLPLREWVLMSLGDMAWAADEVIPLLRKYAEDGSEKEIVRTRAIRSLGGLGKEAIPVLRGYEDSDTPAIREAARDTLANLLEKDGIETKAAYFTNMIERDMFDPRVPAYTRSVGGMFNTGRTHPLREKVKAAYRRRLREKPDPQLAWQLATIIQDQLLNTEIQWAVPAEGASTRQAREAPDENFATLAEVLALGLRHAEKGSDLWRKFGVSLAKLRLLQGDWDGMNAVLTTLGYPTISGDDRPWLCAPPHQWGRNLAEQWGRALPDMRSGDCGLAVRVEKDGKGVAGAHVLVKMAPQPTEGFRTGERGDTLFLTPHPLAYVELGSFGYRGDDRPRTRYGVSDTSGEVVFEKLPQIPVKLEVLIPTGNFSEAARSWDLYMETAPGQLRQARMYGRGDLVRPNDPQAAVELQDGKTFRYPRLVVQPQFGLNIQDWDRVDVDNFALEWHGFTPPPGAKVRYELAMSISAPCKRGRDASMMPVLRTEKEVVATPGWPVGEKGVAGLRLAPGNIYMFQVSAIDEAGKMLAQWRKTCVWTAWAHRESEPPETGIDHPADAPIGHESYFRAVFHRNGRKESLPERVEGYLAEQPKAFECDYVRVGKAWLDWHEGKTGEARRLLFELIRQLPKGNVARTTAIRLLTDMESGAEPRRRLEFIAPPKGEELKLPSPGDDGTIRW